MLSVPSSARRPNVSDGETFTILEPIMAEFVSLYCVVDPKHHVMLPELAAAFFFFAMEREGTVRLDERDREAEGQACVVRLLQRAVPDVRFKGFSSGRRWNYAATGISLRVFP